MIQRLVLLFVAVFAFTALSAQTDEEKVAQLKADKAEKEAELATLQGEVDALQKQIDEFPGWKYGLGGTIGLDFRSFNNWLTTANPNGFASNFAIAGNGFANLDQEKFFWRNGLNMVVGRTKLAVTEAQRDTASYQTSADAINLTSLYGYKLSEKFAISGLGEYRSTFSNINDPGYLDVGVGGTWKPINDLVLVIHPLNYNIVFSSGDFEYQSSLGTKIVADYAKKLPMGIGWKSNFSTFISYKDPSELSNWTWVNGFTTAVKGIGVGFELGLRKNKQEALANGFDDNPLQTYWLLGLSYSL